MQGEGVASHGAIPLTSEERHRNPDLVTAERIGASVREIWKVAKGMSSQKIRDKITIEQYWTLRLLHDSGPQRIKDIAASIGTSSSPVTISVKRLEQRRLVRRERGTKDERVVTVHLTERGKDVFESWREERGRALSSLFDCLDQREKRLLLELLGKVLDSQSRTADAKPAVN